MMSSVGVARGIVCQQVRYSLRESVNGRFTIDEVSGDIETRGSFVNLDGQRLTLTVIQ